MFPVFKGGYGADNLTEIPTPYKTLHDRFLTIEESEPFGPVDAAKILQLEPAETTLKKLTEFNVEETDEQQTEDKKVDVLYGKKREGDRSTFKFVEKQRVHLVIVMVLLEEIERKIGLLVLMLLVR